MGERVWRRGKKGAGGGGVVRGYLKLEVSGLRQDNVLDGSELAR